MINVRPIGGNRSRYIKCPEIREAVIALVKPDVLLGTNDSKVKGQSPSPMD